METFTLKLHITGLGLFAPDPKAPKGVVPAMHLLLPKVTKGGGGAAGHVTPGHDHGAGGHGSHDEHIARIYFDPKDAPDHTGNPWIRVDGFRWTAPATSRPVLDTTLPDEIINITGKASNGAKLPYTQLKHRTQSKPFNVSFHLLLRDGAKADCLVPRARFTVEGMAPTWSTNRLIWEIPGLPRTAFQIDLQPMEDQQQASPQVITIVPRGPEVVLHLLNVPEKEHLRLTPEDEAGEEEPQCDGIKPNHFSAYDRLFLTGATKRIRCVKDSFEPRSCPPSPFAKSRWRAKVIYTCMLATAELDFDDA